jgi:uncharacterized membrane protein
MRTYSRSSAGTAASCPDSAQWGVRALHPPLPLIGIATTITILMGAFLSRGDKCQLTLLLIAAGHFVAAGVITRLLNMPINAVVMNWSPQEPLANWTRLRDSWWRWHILRFGAGTAGLGLLRTSSADSLKLIRRLGRG